MSRLDARHTVASAAGDIAQCAAQVARALAWEAKPGQDPAFVSYLETAAANTLHAHRKLIEAIAEIRLTHKTSPPSRAMPSGGDNRD